VWKNERTKRFQMIQSILEKFSINYYVSTEYGQGNPKEVLAKTARDIKAVLLKELVEKMEEEKYKANHADYNVGWNEALSEAIKIIEEKLR
jgi:hypothetical protein